MSALYRVSDWLADLWWRSLTALDGLRDRREGRSGAGGRLAEPHAPTAECAGCRELFGPD